MGLLVVVGWAGRYFGEMPYGLMQTWHRPLLWHGLAHVVQTPKRRSSRCRCNGKRQASVSLMTDGQGDSGVLVSRS